MKITRKKNGFTIKANDGEYEMLQVAIANLDPKALHGNAKNAYSRRIKGGSILRIDADKRSEPVE